MNLLTYIKESRQEAKKVNWPSKKKTLQHTVIVIAISLAIAIYLGALDFIFQRILALII